jgi:alpha-1,6-mannosyltransferase
VLKTIHLTNAYHEQSGGIRTFYRAMLQAGNARGRHIRLVVPGERDAVEQVGPFARIYFVKAPRSPLIDGRYRLLLPHRFLVPGRGSVWRILAAEQPGVVEICDKYSLCYLAGLLRRLPRDRRPVVVGMSCERMDDNVAAFVSARVPAMAFARWYMRHVYTPQFDVHIANSPYTAAELSTTARPVYVHGMGVDATMFSPQRRDERLRRDLRRQLGADDDSFVLLYVGRLSSEKNVSLLLDCLGRLSHSRRYRLLVIGDGPARASFEARARREFNGIVHLRNTIGERSLLASIVANCDLFVHPNPREPFGIAPLEAMASGVPVVAPNAGGVLAYANDNNAWLVPARPDTFAAAIEAACRYSALRAYRVFEGRRTAERHHWDAVTTSLFGLYDQIALNFRAHRSVERVPTSSSDSIPPGAAVESSGTTSEVPIDSPFALYRELSSVPFVHERD